MKAKHHLLAGLVAFLVTLCLPRWAPAQEQEARYRVEPIYLPALVRPPIRVSRALLPANAGAKLPAFDGDRLILTLAGRPARPMTEREVRAVLDSLLSAINWNRDPGELRYVETVIGSGVDSAAMQQQVERAQRQKLQELTARDSAVRASVADSIRAEAEAFARHAQQRREVFRYDQFFDDVPFDNSGLRALWRSDRGLVSVTGRVFSDVNIANARTLDSDRARRAAEEHISLSTELRPSPAPEPELVILPYGDSLRFAWRMVVTAEEGPYRVWVDAADGRVLQLLPLYARGASWRGHPRSAATEKGDKAEASNAANSSEMLCFDPDPDGGTRVMTPSVNAPVGGQYRLSLTGLVDVGNAGADGVCSGDLLLADDGSGTANFNVAPFNGTVVDRASNANYNCRFQDLNTYGWLSSIIEVHEILGGASLPVINATVNDPNTCGWGADNSCAWSNGYLELGIGSATTSNSTACGDWFNSAIDATVISHELGHVRNWTQYGGTLSDPLNEGLADYWAYTDHFVDELGDWVNRNCGIPVREADAGDVFGPQMDFIDDHERGEMIAWALVSARAELAAASWAGTYDFNTSLLTAMAGAGSGLWPGVSSQNAHAYYIDLLSQLGVEYASSWWMHKVLAGFARSGLLLADADAVIDIDDDFLNRNDANGPTFTVWTGRAYAFNANGTVNAGAMPCNTRFIVEVANDANFTQNLVTSGTQVAGAGCVGIWMLPVTDWNQVKNQDQIYYRASTTDAMGGNGRTSTSPGDNAFVGVPAGRALVNESGEEECCNTGGSMAVLTLVPVLGAAIWRRRGTRRR